MSSKFVIHAEGTDLAEVIQNAASQADQLVKRHLADYQNKQAEPSQAAEPSKVDSDSTGSTNSIATAKGLLPRLPDFFKTDPTPTESEAKKILANFKFKNPMTGVANYSFILSTPRCIDNFWVKTPIGNIELFHLTKLYTRQLKLTKIELLPSLVGYMVAETDIVNEGKCLALLPLAGCYELAPIIKTQTLVFDRDASLYEQVSISVDEETETYVKHQKGEEISVSIIRESDTLDYIYTAQDGSVRLVIDVPFYIFAGFKTRGTVTLDSVVDVRFKKQNELYEFTVASTTLENYTDLEKHRTEEKLIKHEKDEVIQMYVVKARRLESDDDVVVAYTYDNKALGCTMYVRNVTFSQVFELVD